MQEDFKIKIAKAQKFHEENKLNLAIKDIKAGEELAANYNLYTYPKTGIGIQML